MTAWTDPHASDIDKKILQNGWFAGNMPDLDLTNPELFRYLSQAYIWWIEYADVDGIRVDTYPYNDIQVAANWVKTFRDEYPNINIVGECWVKSPLEIAYYQSGNNNKDGFDSQLPSVMDFVLKDHLHAAFNEQDSWDFGTSRFYAHYAQDFAYPDVDNVMNFLDNHDIDRFSTAVKRDVNKYKMGIAMLLTTRGYPQIYAGTEIMIDGIPGNYEGHRFDFPGGWDEDERDAFTKEGRTAEENEVFDYTRALLNYRKTASALHNGKMKQFIPYDGIYFYARYNDEQTVLCIFNNGNADKKITLERYAEVIKDFTKGEDVVTGETFNLADGLTIEGKSALIVELK
jgi:glycosidase